MVAELPEWPAASTATEAEPRERQWSHSSGAAGPSGGVALKTAVGAAKTSIRQREKGQPRQRSNSCHSGQSYGVSGSSLGRDKKLVGEERGGELYKNQRRETQALANRRVPESCQPLRAMELDAQIQGL